METLIRNNMVEIIESLKKDGKFNEINEEDASQIFSKIEIDLQEHLLELNQKEKDSEIEASNIVLTF